MENAINAGIQVGVYFYSQAITTKEAVEEAQFVLDYLDGYDIAYPVVFDIEGAPSASARTNKLTPQKASNIAIAFCDEIQQAGYETMVYSYTKYFVEKMDLSLLTQYNTWLAQYYEQPFFPYEFDIWQYTSTGKVNGIKGNVDMNLHFID